VRSTRRNLGGARCDGHDRAALVEVLSNQRLRREEQDRRRLATDLHEDLAQSLSAIKFAAESVGSGQSQGTRGAEAMHFVVSELQHAIQRVRSMASELRPSSLDDFGVLATIRATCHEFEDRHPQIRVELETTGREDLIPASLGIVVYRNVESALKLIGDLGLAKRVRITLDAERDSLVLAVADDMSRPLREAAFVARDVDTESPLSPIRERTIMSGGELAVTRGDAGAVELRARWTHPHRPGARA
jgi:two-component system, NarL family, sensor kinase